MDQRDARLCLGGHMGIAAGEHRACPGTQGLNTLQYALSTCFKPAGCQSKMSSKPNLIDIMPYAAASS